MAEGEGFGLQAAVENTELIDFYGGTIRQKLMKRGYLVRNRYTIFSLCIAKQDDHCLLQRAMVSSHCAAAKLVSRLMLNTQDYMGPTLRYMAQTQRT